MYMDRQHYAATLNENLDKNIHLHYYPVKIKALRMDWILNTDYGKDFLASIITNKNLDHYSNETCQMIIEFLFFRFQSYIYSREFYTFLLEIVLCSFLMVLNELVHEYDLMKWGVEIIPDDLTTE